MLWRILYSNNKVYEPTLIRHLYDLSVLKEIVLSNKCLFRETLLDVYNQDRAKRDKNDEFDNFQDAFKKLYNLFKYENKFKKIYQNFVQNMCYDLTQNNFTFEQSLEILKEIIDNIFLIKTE